MDVICNRLPFEAPMEKNWIRRCILVYYAIQSSVEEDSNSRSRFKSGIRDYNKLLKWDWPHIITKLRFRRKCSLLLMLTSIETVGSYEGIELEDIFRICPSITNNHDNKFIVVVVLKTTPSVSHLIQSVHCRRRSGFMDLRRVSMLSHQLYLPAK